MHTSWASQKREEMLSLWGTHFQEHQDGFEMFTSPLYEDSAAIVIGYNPGGDLYADTKRDQMEVFTSNHPDKFTIERLEAEGVQDHHKHYLPDRKPEYERASDVPTRIRERLFNGKEHLLLETVETNRYYMRSDGSREHRDFLEGLDASVKKEYEKFCQETTRGVIKRTSPSTVIEFANITDSASEFCADLDLSCKAIETHRHKNEGKADAVVDVVELTESPYSTVVSVEPHLSGYPGWDEEMLTMLENTVPQYLPE